MDDNEYQIECVYWFPEINISEFALEEIKDRAMGEWGDYIKNARAFRRNR